MLDAGTGLQRLSLVLDGQAFRGTLLLSHLHWDHTHGMPFFRSGALPGSRVDVYLPEQGVEPEELLARAISPPHFPIRPKQLGDGWTFNALEPGHYAGLPSRSQSDFPRPGPDGTGVFHEAAITLTEGADLLDALAAQHAAAPVRVFAAHDGMVVNLP